jgi:hypothetical protein
MPAWVQIPHPAPTKTSDLEGLATCSKEKTLGIYRYERRLELAIEGKGGIKKSKKIIPSRTGHSFKSQEVPQK